MQTRAATGAYIDLVAQQGSTRLLQARLVVNSLYVQFSQQKMNAVDYENRMAAFLERLPAAPTHYDCAESVLIFEDETVHRLMLVGDRVVWQCTGTIVGCC